MMHVYKEQTLLNAKIGEEVTITGISTDDEELDSFLFTLGCYKGERIVVISKVGHGLVVAIKDSRYNIDEELAEAICI